MRKTVAAGILAAALTGSLGLFACGSGTVESSAEQGQQAAEAEAAPDSDYQVSIDSAVVSEDYNGKPVVIVTYSWTNNSDDTTSAMVALYEKVFQDGVQLSGAFAVDGLDSDGYMADVRPGASTTFQQAYELSNTESPVEVEVTELLSFSDDILAQATFEL